MEGGRLKGGRSIEVRLYMYKVRKDALKTYLGLLLILKLQTTGIPENQNPCLLKQTWCRHTLLPYGNKTRMVILFNC